MDTTVSTATPGTLRRVWSVISQFRLIPRIDKMPGIVSFAQKPLGKLVVLAVFALEMSYFYREPFYVGVLVSLVGVVSFIPEYRHLVLAFAPLAFAFLTHLNTPLLLGMTFSVIGIGVLLYWCAMRWPDSAFGRRPVLFLLSGFVLLIAVACVTRPRTALYTAAWTLVSASTEYVWFIAYAVSDRASKPRTDLTLEVASLRPMWGSTNTPFPKGAAYLRRIEARTPEQFAIAQLKGIKLLTWAIALSAFTIVWNWFFHSYLVIPTSADAIARNVHGTPVAWHLRWESLILAFFENILSISVIGHRLIAGCRLVGFNALRNTYKPLQSTTISEFFNRFYYYFKELLVDFFFYPTFLRYFKRHKKLRLVFATFAAAFFGNTVFHFTRDWQIIRDHGLVYAMWSYEASLLYCFLLACGLSISELRKRKPRNTSFLRGRLVPAAGVALFYCLLDVFVTNERGYGLSVYLKYFASLFSLHF